MDVDLGVLKLTSAPPGLDDLRTEAMQQGRWNDYTKHYGKPSPTWHALDARGIGRDATVKDFRGKWLLIDFWGLSCVPCLATGIPGMMDFYEEYAAQRNQFEIVSVCIDYTGELKSIDDLDAAIAPVVANVWDGRRIEFPIVLDNTFISWERFGIPGLGTVVLIDPEGNLVEGDEKTLHRILQGDAERPQADP